MPKIPILLFSLIISNLSFGQRNQEKDIILNNDSVYSSLLLKHIQYLESQSSIRNALNDSAIYIKELFPITRFIPDSIGDRKVFLVNSTKLDYFVLSNNKNLIEIRPMYFLDNTINIVFRDLYLRSINNSYDIVVQGGSQFVFEFDCERNVFILKDIKH